ncbi:MAG: pyruvate ferredoxin oxidoreductase [Candidatus Woesearchaeota archaeon]
MVQKKMKGLTGSEASAEAMRQIDPDVVPVYPITPQTPVMHTFSKYISDGEVNTELIRVESEHSAMSATVGASAAGARVMTATSANGLALMHEVVYIAASSRLPIVMTVVNRALSGPINIHCDHSDTMAERDSGWLQFYCSNAQEVYDMTIIAMKVAEHKDVLLPVMVCQDGFITSHGVENVETLDNNTVKMFIGEHTPTYPLLDTDNPVTYGPLDLFDYYFEHKRQQSEAMMHSRKIVEDVFSDFAKITGRHYSTTEDYMLDDADHVILVMSSTADTAKEVVDDLRSKGEKAGLLKLNVFRPFPVGKIIDSLRGKKAVGVMDRSESFGAMGAALFNEVRSALFEVPEHERPKIINYIYGLGGRDCDDETLSHVFKELKALMDEDHFEKVRYLGVRE